MWALSDFTARNGSTRFLPGSHTWWRPHQHQNCALLPPGIEDGLSTVQACMPKGSVVMWLGGTLHGASAQSPRAPGEVACGSSVRRGMLFIYNLGYLAPEHNFHWAMPRHVLKSFGPKLADLVGLSGENAVEHAWYDGPVYAQPYLGGPDGSAAAEGVQF